jgi:hypothetical protein
MSKYAASWQHGRRRTGWGAALLLLLLLPLACLPFIILSRSP